MNIQPASTFIRLVLCSLLAGGLAACSSTSANTLSPEAQAGEAVFMQMGCANCHATSTEQRAGPGLFGILSAEDASNNRLPNGELRSETSVAAWIREQASNSESGMPAYPTLSETELQALITYLKTLQ